MWSRYQNSPPKSCSRTTDPHRTDLGSHHVSADLPFPFISVVLIYVPKHEFSSFTLWLSNSEGQSLHPEVSFHKRSLLQSIRSQYIAVFWVFASCNLVDRPDDGGSKYLWNADKRLPDYTAQQPRKQPSTYSPPWEPEISPFGVSAVQPPLSTCFLLHAVLAPF
jgi:hypothetical protein